MYLKTFQCLIFNALTSLIFIIKVAFLVCSGSINNVVMNNYFKRVILIFGLIVATNVLVFGSNKNDNNTKTEFNWEPIIEAIIHVESKGDPNAKSGNSVGVLQITPILVAECNNIMKMRNNSKRYSLKDRFSIAKSKEMFLTIQSFHNPMNNVERAIRSWNGGMKYRMKRTQKYFEKVMKALNKKQ